MKATRKPKKSKPVNGSGPRELKFLERMIVKHGGKKGGV